MKIDIVEESDGTVTLTGLPKEELLVLLLAATNDISQARVDLGRLVTLVPSQREMRTKELVDFTERYIRYSELLDRLESRNPLLTDWAKDNLREHAKRGICFPNEIDESLINQRKDD